jgi:hypothetical protein
MNKDFWDKLGIIATFIQIVVIGAFTAVVSLYTARMNNKLDTYKTGMDESGMIQKLVMDLSTEDSSNVKTDFALLSLERYLRSSKQGELQDYDKNMLCGFAESIIWDRIRKKKNENEILIPIQFLSNNDTLREKELLSKIKGSETQTTHPDKVNDSLINVKPVNQVNDTGSMKAISFLFNKTCYIQYADMTLKDTAEKFRKKLVAKGWYAPGIEYVEGNYKTSIRYFHPEDNGLVASLQDLFENNNVITSPIYKFGSRVPKGQVEVWIGK